MKSAPVCPKCRAEIPLEDVNVSKDIALCRQLTMGKMPPK
jgi:hypothetical protein